MRRATFAVLSGALMLLLAAGMALAAFVECTGGRCEGTPQDDNIEGSQIADRAFGLGGEDEIDLEAGDDEANGGTRDDNIIGEGGDDTLNGNKGDDRVVDRDEGGDVDVLRGGPGGDFIGTSDGDRFDTVVCGPGFDTAQVDVGDSVSDDCESLRD